MARKIFRTGVKVLCALCAGIFLAILIITIILYKKGLFEPADFSLLNDPSETSKILDSDGNVIQEYCEYCREKGNLKDFGRFSEFVIAVEDKDFRTRPFAISFEAMARAGYENAKASLEHRSKQQGGSTITQQTARNILATRELRREWGATTESGKSRARWWRKLREIWLAVELEHRLSRDEILELYLNTFYCGNQRYGAKACGEYYFQKEPRELTIPETATLLGLLRTPSAAKNPELTLKKRNIVIAQLARGKIISQTAGENFSRMPLGLAKHIPASMKSTAHFAEFVRREIVKDGNLVDRGLTIHTALNSGWQKVLSDSLEASIKAMKRRNPELTDLRGGAIIIDARTGAIKAWAQKPEGDEYLLNQIRRHTGSAFKPFVYTSFIEKGGRLTCNDEGTGQCLVDDSPAIAVRMGGGTIHRIQNFPYKKLQRNLGMVEAIVTLSQSRNDGTMSLEEGVLNSRVPPKYRSSKEEIINTAAKLGISKPKEDPGLTVAIGSIDISPIEMAAAWTGFLGNKVEPYAIESVDGDQIKIVAHSSGKQVLEESIQLQILRGLRATVELPHGTASDASIKLDFPVMGKTGTATDWGGETTDNWFVGCSPSYCAAIWIGRDKKLPMRTTKDEHREDIQETGGRNCLPVFISVMKTIYENREKERFPEATDPKKPFISKSNEIK